MHSNWRAAAAEEDYPGGSSKERTEEREERKQRASSEEKEDKAEYQKTDWKKKEKNKTCDGIAFSGYHFLHFHD